MEQKAASLIRFSYCQIRMDGIFIERTDKKIQFPLFYKVTELLIFY